jgi:UDP-N-acetylglucosamine transferase subunit ALG13
MILVLLGTFPLKFERPLIELDRLLKEGAISEEVIVQNGHTVYDSPRMTFFPFLPLDELLDLYRRADLVITQAGTGSIIKGLKMNKKMIAVARLAKYGEHVDDHQVELIQEFAGANYLIAWNETDDLAELIPKAKNFEPTLYKSSNKEIVNYLIDYIDNI